jgi:ubiquinone/menaquinone biosynthesis C-methylase UbiE
VKAAVFHDRDGWLSLLEELFDPPTVERLERVGVGPGWEALEVGAGRGSIAAWLAERVRPEGRVLATDVDTTLLEERADPGVEVLRHDVLADDFPPASFDLVHCRAVLVHLADPERAVARMADWLKPGGVLVAEEPWTDVARLAPDATVARAAGAP